MVDPLRPAGMRPMVFPLLGAVFLIVLGAMTAPPAHAADPEEIAVDTPGPLLSGIEGSWQLGGTWYAAVHQSGGQLEFEITLRLTPASQPDQPGPVVIIWQQVVSVADADFGDSSRRGVGEPQTLAVQPSCTSGGDCALRFRTVGPVAPAFEAADLEGVVAPTVTFWFTAIRTYRQGDVIQVVEPGVALVAAGTLSEPMDSYGWLAASGVFPLADAQPVMLPSAEFWRGDPPAYDWGAAVSSELAAFVAPPSPEPIPTYIWTQDQADARRVRVRIAPRDFCAGGGWLVSLHTPDGAMVAPVVGGAWSLVADLALDPAAEWVITLQQYPNVVVASATIPPGSGPLLVSSDDRCVDADGILDVEPFPSPAPLPTVDATAVPSARALPTLTPSRAHPPTWPDAAGVASLLVIGLGVIGFALLVWRAAGPRSAR